MSANKIRSDRLAKFFWAVSHGKQEVENINDFKRFVEAILDQADHCSMIERLIASQPALTALRNGLRFSVTPTFINQYTARLVQYMDDPRVKGLCNGQFLQQL